MVGSHMEEHSSPIKTPRQLIVAVVLAFAVPVIAIIMIAEFASGGLKVDPKSPAMSDEAVAQRIKPVGEVVIGEAGAPTAVQPIAKTGVPGQSASATQKPAGGVSDGKKTYESACALCHAAGIAGAPKTGDKTAWKTRLAQGKTALYTSALKGKNAMPAKGGATSLSDADVKAAVDYLASLAK